jgi:hypothetical protein
MVIFYTVQYTPRKTIFEVIESVQMPDIETTYRSYLLRLWHETEPGAPWRVMLESVAEPGERHYFKDLESLIAYLFVQQEPASEKTNEEGDHDI